MRIKKKKDALLLGRLARAPWRVGVEPYRGGDRSASSNVTCVATCSGVKNRDVLLEKRVHVNRGFTDCVVKISF